MSLSARFDEALAYAHEVHRDHLRKGTQIPYISHLMAVAAIPLFALIAKVSLPAIMGGQLGLMLLVVLFTSPALVIATELFSKPTRYSGVAVGYNLGATIFGGTAPLLCTALISITDWNLAPGLLLAVASLLILIVVYKAPETAPIRTGELQPPA